MNDMTNKNNLEAQRIDDSKRIQKVLDEIHVKNNKQGSHSKPFTMEPIAQKVLIEYANEITVSIMEGARLLAQHRNSNEVSVEDVNLILG
jgi:histone H3/H4